LKRKNTMSITVNVVMVPLNINKPSMSFSKNRL
jgi:hypothetical protein